MQTPFGPEAENEIFKFRFETKFVNKFDQLGFTYSWPRLMKSDQLTGQKGVTVSLNESEVI